jgi:hypothetical protein
MKTKIENIKDNTYHGVYLIIENSTIEIAESLEDFCWRFGRGKTEKVDCDIIEDNKMELYSSDFAVKADFMKEVRALVKEWKSNF